jgi:hypothetical protein
MAMRHDRSDLTIFVLCSPCIVQLTAAKCIVKLYFTGFSESTIHPSDYFAFRETVGAIFESYPQVDDHARPELPYVRAMVFRL